MVGSPCRLAKHRDYRRRPLSMVEKSWSQQRSGVRDPGSVSPAPVRQLIADFRGHLGCQVCCAEVGLDAGVVVADGVRDERLHVCATCLRVHARTPLQSLVRSYRSRRGARRSLAFAQLLIRDVTESAHSLR